MRISVSTTVACAIVCSFGSACSPIADEPTRERIPEARLSVLSYNLNFGIPGEPSTIALIRRQDADIVLLQETNPAWARALRAELDDIYPYMDFRHCCRAGGLGILSHYPFDSREYIPSPTKWFPAWRLLARTPLGHIQLLNVHLRPPVSDGGSWLLGQFTTAGIRLAEITEFARHLDFNTPTIVAGDFNEQG